MNNAMPAVPFTIDNRDYVILPRGEYEKLAGVRAGDAATFAHAAVARGLRAAREHAGLSQVALAKKIKKSQAHVSNAESGSAGVTEKYILSVLKACGLPKDWVAPAAEDRRVVHHVDGDPQNNAPDNLRVVPAKRR